MNSIKKGERRSRDAFKQGSLRLGPRKNPNAKQNAKQQSRAIPRHQVRSDGTLGLRRFDRPAEECFDLTQAIRDDLPSAEVTITTEPRALDDETVRERVMVIARDLGLAIHHVAVQTVSGRLSVSADLEVDGTMPLNVAHDIASGLEDGVREELGPDVEVETHIEPLLADGLDGRDAPAARVAEMVLT